MTEHTLAGVLLEADRQMQVLLKPGGRQTTGLDNTQKYEAG